mgnify:FL=1
MEDNSRKSADNTPQIKPRRVYPMWQCPICGTRAWVTNKKRHLYTKKHKDVLYVTTERFEMR